MRVWCISAAAAAFVFAGASPAKSQTLTLEQALQLARSRAPEVLAALARVDEARGRLLGASIRFRDNPVLELDMGPRQGPSRRTLDFAAGFGQTFETGGQPAARKAAAEADVAAAVASADEASRLVSRALAIAYIRALGADERARILTAAEAVAAQLRDASERRYQAGDIAALDLNLTRIAAARARAERIQGEAARLDALRPLRLAVGVTAAAPVVLTGSLDRQPAPRTLLLTAIEQAPALRRTDADIAQARAEVALANGMRRPDVGTRLSVRGEQDDTIVTAGVSIALPLFNRGQGTRAEADARTRRLTQERASVLSALQLELDAGLDVYARHRAAAEALRDAALPAADDNETLAARSFDAGAVNLLDYLRVRQDVMATRLAYVDAITDTAIAAVEIDAAAGLLR